MLRLAAATLFAVLIAAGAAAAAPGELRVDRAGRFADSTGRDVVLRGGAVIRKTAPGLPVIGAPDWANMRALGWNSIRLGTSWEHIEPAPGDYDEAYLDALAALARDAMDHGLYVVIDMHQDVWGKPAGNGHPAWTTYSQCAGTHVDLAGAAGTFAANYFSPFTICQFTRFWTDAQLQDRYAAALAQVARRLGGERLLAGYDVMNEPFQGALPPAVFEAAALFPFYARVMKAVRAHDPDAIAFLEPANAKNVHLPTASIAGRLPGAAAYAPHVYGLWDANDLFTQREPLVSANMAFSLVEARLLGVPLWYGEFGMRRSAPRAEETLTQIYGLADRQRAGAAVWEYARNEYGVLRADGTLDPARAITVARPYPAATAGLLRRFAFDRATGVFELEWRSAGPARATLVALPELSWPAGRQLALTAGAVATPVPGGISITASAGEHRLRVTR